MTKETIAILGGTGPEGAGLAMRWAAAGYPILIGSRDAARAAAGRAARDHVATNHAIEGEARALVEIYNDLLARP